MATVRERHRRGQSETVGLVILVAVALVLVGAIGLVLVTETDSTGEESVFASLDSDVSGDGVTVGHIAGDSLDPDAVTVVVDGPGTDLRRPLSMSPDATGRFSGGDGWTLGADREYEGPVRVLVIHDPTNTVLHDESHEVEGEKARASIDLSALDIAGQGSAATVDRSADESVAVTVTNEAETDRTVTLELELGGQAGTTKTTGSLAPGAAERVIFESATAGREPGTYDVVVGTDDVDVGGTLTVAEASSPRDAIALGTTDETVSVYSGSNWAQETSLHGAGGDVNAVTYSPDGSRLAFGSVDGTVHVFEPDGWGHEQTLDIADEEVRALAWSPDGTRLVAGLLDGTVAVYEPGSWDRIQKLDTPAGSVWDVAVSPGGEFVAVGTPDGVAVHETGDWQLARELTDTGFVDSVAWSPNGTALAAGTVQGTVAVHETETWNETQELDAAEGIVRSVSFSSDGSTLAYGDETGTVTVHETSSWSQTTAFTSVADVWSVDFSPDGTTLAYGSDGATATLHRTDTWEQTATIETTAPVRAVSLWAGSE